MATKTEHTIREELIFTLPKEIIDDLKHISAFNKTDLEKLVYSYIVDGIASDARAARRKKFTDRANEVWSKNNIPPKSVEDIFDNLIY